VADNIETIPEEAPEKPAPQPSKKSKGNKNKVPIEEVEEPTVLKAEVKLEQQATPVVMPASAPAVPEPKKHKKGTL